MSDSDWKRAGRAVEERITSLGMDYSTVAGKVPCSESYLWHVRKGRQVSPRMRRKIEVALRWPQETLDRLATDPYFEPPSLELTDPERLSAVERETRELSQRMDSIETKIDELVRRLSDLG